MTIQPGQSVLPRLGAAQWPTSAYPRGELPERVMQFGTGMLLRALCATAVDAVNRAGAFQGRIVAVQSTPQGRGDILNAQDGLFTLVERGLENGRRVERTRLVGSISRALVADGEWPTVRELVTRPELQIIVSNVTEAGFRPDGPFPVRCLDLLYERFERLPDGPPVFVIPTELVGDNGPPPGALGGPTRRQPPARARVSRVVAQPCPVLLLSGRSHHHRYARARRARGDRAAPRLHGCAPHRDRAKLPLGDRGGPGGAVRHVRDRRRAGRDRRTGHHAIPRAQAAFVEWCAHGAGAARAAGRRPDGPRGRRASASRPVASPRPVRGARPRHGPAGRCGGELCEDGCGALPKSLARSPMVRDRDESDRQDAGPRRAVHRGLRHEVWTRPRRVGARLRGLSPLHAHGRRGDTGRGPWVVAGRGVPDSRRRSRPGGPPLGCGGPGSARGGCHRRGGEGARRPRARPRRALAAAELWGTSLAHLPGFLEAVTRSLLVLEREGADAALAEPTATLS